MRSNKLAGKWNLGFISIEFMCIAVLVIVSFTYLHYTVPFKGYSAQDWVDGVVAMPLGGRALAPDLVAWMARFAHIPSDSVLIPYAFQGLELASFSIASLVIPLTTMSLTGDRQAAYLSYGLFVWQAFYTFVISPRHRFWFPYDILTLAVLSMALLFIVRSRFGALLALTAIGSWNRETTILLPFFYLLYNRPENGRILQWPPAVLARAALLLAISLIVKFLVLYIHGRSSGIVSLYHGGTNLRLFRNLMIWKGGVFVCAGAFGFLWILVPRALAALGNVRFACIAWTFPFYLAGMLVVGNVDEIRIFAEFIPYLSVLLAVAWRRGVV